MEAKQYVKNGDFFKYYYEEFGWITEQHSELFSGKVEINPEWEIIQESIGTIYIVNKKSEDGK